MKDSNISRRKLCPVLAWDYGMPLYVYDADFIREQTHLYREAFFVVPG